MSYKTLLDEIKPLFDVI